MLHLVTANVRELIKAAVAKPGVVALPQARFVQGVSLVRCSTQIFAMAACGIEQRSPGTLATAFKMTLLARFGPEHVQHEWREPAPNQSRRPTLRN